jgi:thioredoxin 1
MKGNFNDIIQSKVPVLIDVHAEWCGPCKMQSPIIKEVASELGERVRVIKIDADRNPDITRRYDIRGVPTLLIFRDGVLKYRKAGLHTKPELMNILSGLL